MTTLLHDAKCKVIADSGADRVGWGSVPISELVYADDTLIIAGGGEETQAYMNAIHTVGAQYGLQFNWGKLEVLPIRCADAVFTADGATIESKVCIKYLGGTLLSGARCWKRVETIQTA